MNDRISNYRSARLSLFLPHRPGSDIRWSLLKLGVRNGIPSGVILGDGLLPNGRVNPSEQDVWEYLDAVVRQNTLPR